MAVSEDKDGVVFLHRIVPGGADKSYGVHVARLAGLPASVVHRAWEVLGELENGAVAGHGDRPRSGKRWPESSRQLPLLGASHPAIEGLLGLEVASMTPLEAINKLYELQEKARDGST